MPEMSLTLPVRQLVEFLLRTGSIDNRFAGFDRALEGARLHRKLQKQAVKDHPDYAAEVALRHTLTVAEVEYTIEGRADGIFTAPDGTVRIPRWISSLRQKDGSSRTCSTGRPSTLEPMSALLLSKAATMLSP